MISKSLKATFSLICMEILYMQNSEREDGYRQSQFKRSLSQPHLPVFEFEMGSSYANCQSGAASYFSYALKMKIVCVFLGVELLYNSLCNYVTKEILAQNNHATFPCNTFKI